MASTTPPAATQQPSHYPLNGLDLSFSRYHHRELDVADIAANRIMNRWLFPHGTPQARRRPARTIPPLKGARVIPDGHTAEVDATFASRDPSPRSSGRIPALKPGTPPHPAEDMSLQLALDTRIIYHSQTTRGGGYPCLASSPSDTSDPTANRLAVLRRHVFETSHPEIRPWLRWLPRGYPSPATSSPDVSTGCCPTHTFSLDREGPSPAEMRRCVVFFARSTARYWYVMDVAYARVLYLTSASRPLRALPDPLAGEGPILQDARRALGPLLWRPGPAGVAPPVPNVMSYLPTWRGPAKVPMRDLPEEAGDQVPPDQLVPPFRELPAPLPGIPAGLGNKPILIRSMTCPAAAYSTTLRTRRPASEPPAGAYMLTTVQDAYVHPHKGRESEPMLTTIATTPELYLRNRLCSDTFLLPLYVPCPRVSDVDHRTRRRSLSRRHVARMFHSPSRASGCVLTPHPEVRFNPEPLPPRKLPPRCGWCGSVSHPPHACPVPASSRCKCGPFPTYHAAKACPVVCSRPCGDPRRRGGSRHRCAMTCRSRCCMCGIRGHSGRECRLVKCRCGGRHLGQDCGWKPGCRVRGCDRYLCGVHCRECGSAERPFVGWRCGACLGNGEPVGDRAEGRPGKRRRGRRKGKAGPGAGAGREEGQEERGSSRPEKVEEGNERGRGRKK